MSPWDKSERVSCWSRDEGATAAGAHALRLRPRHPSSLSLFPPLHLLKRSPFPFLISSKSSRRGARSEGEGAAGHESLPVRIARGNNLGFADDDERLGKDAHDSRLLVSTAAVPAVQLFADQHLVSDCQPQLMQSLGVQVEVGDDCRSEPPSPSAPG